MEDGQCIIYTLNELVNVIYAHKHTKNYVLLVQCMS